MMKTKIITILATALLIVSCSKDSELPTVVGGCASKGVVQIKDVELENSLIDQYARTVASALTNSEFRALVKGKALKQFDGDYDILASDLHDDVLEIANCSVSELLSMEFKNIYPDSSIYASILFVSSIVDKIPNLQISVPANCESWNTETFIPKVVPIPIDFDERDEYIKAFDKEGNTENVSLEVDPTVPFVVVRESERVGRNGHLKQCINMAGESIGDTPVLSTPSGLVVSNGLPNQLLLQWVDVENEHGYSIYRRSTNDNYSKVDAVEANENMYADNGLEAGRMYYYKVRALDAQGNPSGYSMEANAYASEREINDSVIVEYAKFDSRKALRAVEPWVAGKPEIVLRVLGPTSSTAYSQVREINWYEPKPKRNEVCDDWWHCKMSIAKWNVSQSGYTWTFNWSECDNVQDYELSLSLNATWKDTSGHFQFGGGPSVKIKITKHNNIGSAVVNFWDLKNTVYKTETGFRFKLKNV